jgi:LAO/AO transport system kinase
MSHHYLDLRNRRRFLRHRLEQRGHHAFPAADQERGSHRATVQRRVPGAEPGVPTPEVAEVVAAVQRYFAGEETDFSGIKLDLGEQDRFFQQVYAAARRVGWGRTTTYGTLAKELGAGPEAARDVGLAMSRTRWPLIIPCHRVLAAGGKVGGFLRSGRLGGQGAHAGAGGRSRRAATAGPALVSGSEPAVRFPLPLAGDSTHAGGGASHRLTAVAGPQVPRSRSMPTACGPATGHAGPRPSPLIESAKDAHMAQAQALLQRLLPHTGTRIASASRACRGVGKSTAIDQLGMNLVEQGHGWRCWRSIPTSTRSGGSILGDKTRMVRLAQSRAAFIRPSPTSGTLGGVARKTRETMLLVEAAGFDVVIVETVGVGQSEVAVAAMVDFFLVLLLAGGGDDLQGIKRGIIEIADMIAITKADGDNIARAKKAAAIYQGALGIITPTSPAWVPPVLTISAQDNRGPRRGVGAHPGASRAHDGDRRVPGPAWAQAVDWMHDLLQERLLAALEADASVAARCGRAGKRGAGRRAHARAGSCRAAFAGRAR